MSEAAELIEQVHAAGGRVLAVGDRLRLQAPQPLPDDLIEALRAHKAEVLREIGGGPNVGSPPSERTGQGALVTLRRVTANPYRGGVPTNHIATAGRFRW